MTGFEFHRHLNPINKIKNFRVQMTEKHGKKSANLQPDATKILDPNKPNGRGLERLGE